MHGLFLNEGDNDDNERGNDNDNDLLDEYLLTIWSDCNSLEKLTSSIDSSPRGWFSSFFPQGKKDVILLNPEESFHNPYAFSYHWLYN